MSFAVTVIQILSAFVIFVAGYLAFGLDQSDRIRGNDGLPCGAFEQHLRHTRETREKFIARQLRIPQRIFDNTDRNGMARLLGNAWPFYFRIVPSCSSPLKLATLAANSSRDAARRKWSWQHGRNWPWDPTCLPTRHQKPKARTFPRPLPQCPCAMTACRIGGSSRSDPRQGAKSPIQQVNSPKSPRKVLSECMVRQKWKPPAQWLVLAVTPSKILFLLRFGARLRIST